MKCNKFHVQQFYLNLHTITRYFESAKKMHTRKADSPFSRTEINVESLIKKIAYQFSQC